MLPFKIARPLNPLGMRGLASFLALRHPKRMANRRTARPLQRSVVLGEIEDRRLFNPGRFVDFKVFSGAPVRYVVRPRKVKFAAVDEELNTRLFDRNWVPTGIGFLNPVKTLVCVRRQMRKEVLHALHRVGGGQRVAPPRFRESSYIQC